MTGSIDYSRMTCYIDDAEQAYRDWCFVSPDEPPASELLLVAIHLSLQAIAVALSANHLENKYPGELVA